MRYACALLLVACAGTDPAAPGQVRGAWVSLLDGSGLQGWQVTPFGGEGEVRLEGAGALLGRGSPLTGLTWLGEFPDTDYELRLSATLVSGTDFFLGLTFPVGDQAASLILGGWGGSLTGLSCLDGLDASENHTKRFIAFESGRPYRVTLLVRRDRVLCSLDDEPLVELDPREFRLEVRTEVEPSLPLGVASYVTEAHIERVRFRRL